MTNSLVQVGGRILLNRSKQSFSRSFANPARGACRLSSLTLTQATSAIEDGHITSQELTIACIKQANNTKWTNSFVSMCDEAMMQAAASDARTAQGMRLGPLDGIPLGIKDNFAMSGTDTSCASEMLKGFRAPFDATAVARLKNAGAVIVGKTNMDEFAMGSSNIHSAYGPVVNPWSRSIEDKGEFRVAGGSSGGSAAAVASRSVFGALGSDTGGSVRLPAAHCGIVGFKPRYGGISRFGLVSFASSFDTPGIFARTVGDATTIHNALVGKDLHDATSVNADAIGAFGCSVNLKGLRIAAPNEFYVPEISSEMHSLWKSGLEALLEAGATGVANLSIPSVPRALSAYYVITSAEASSNLARYDSVRYGQRISGNVDSSGVHGMSTEARTALFGSEVQRRILTGTFVLSDESYGSFFEAAQRVRAKIVSEFEHAFEQCDVIVTPACHRAASLFSMAGRDTVEEYCNDAMLVPSSLAGLPSVTVPVGFDSEGCPVALQLVATSEQTLMTAAYALEQSFGVLSPPPVI